MTIFVFPQEVDFIAEALSCAFKDRWKKKNNAFTLQGYRNQNVYVEIRGEVNLTMTPNKAKSKAFVSDTGDLQSAHNFVRFYLQDLMRVDKVVYLDVDIVVQADISALYDDEEIRAAMW